jgi:HAD superfamily hydrolase (TIGR01457 family)
MTSNLREHLARIRFFILDMDGTFYLGNRLFDGSLAFIDKLKHTGRDYLFLTNNSSKSAEIYAEKLTRMGLPTTPDRVFTSGEATIIFLQKEHPRAKVYLIGTPSLEKEFLQAGIDLVEKNPDIVTLGFDTTLTYEKIRNGCNFIRRGAKFIATHPDFNVPLEEGPEPDCGSMIAMFTASTGVKPKVIGKPNKEIVEALMIKVKRPMHELAIVGDRLYTDIATGTNAGITSICVLTGEATLEDLKISSVQPTFVVESLKSLIEFL